MFTQHFTDYQLPQMTLSFSIDLEHELKIEHTPSVQGEK